jgi:hypothetical protein
MTALIIGPATYRAIDAKRLRSALPRRLWWCSRVAGTMIKALAAISHALARRATRRLPERMAKLVSGGDVLRIPLALALGQSRLS